MAPNGGGARGLPAAVPLVGCSSAGVLVRGRRHDRDKRLLHTGHLAIAGGQTSRQRAPRAVPSAATRRRAERGAEGGDRARLWLARRVQEAVQGGRRDAVRQRLGVAGGRGRQAQGDQDAQRGYAADQPGPDAAAHHGRMGARVLHRRAGARRRATPATCHGWSVPQRLAVALFAPRTRLGLWERWRFARDSLVQVGRRMRSLHVGLRVPIHPTIWQFFEKGRLVITVLTEGRARAEPPPGLHFHFCRQPHQLGQGGGALCGSQVIAAHVPAFVASHVFTGHHAVAWPGHCLGSKRSHCPCIM